MIWDDHFTKMKKTLMLSQDLVTIISPYISEKTLQLLISDINIPIRILTSWRIDDFKSGLAKTSLAQKCIDNNWEIYVLHDGHKRKLHTKAYISDSRDIWIGSANLTDKGLGINKNPNFEVMMLSTISEAMGKHVNQLFSIASKIDHDLIEKFKQLEILIPEMEDFELDWSAPLVIDGLTISSQILESIGGQYIFEKLWNLMPSKPDLDDQEKDYSDENNLHLIGRRWGEFRQVLREMDIDRDLIDNKIRVFYDWAENEHEKILEIKTGGRGNYTQCLVWKLE
jgi:hypothetical protein